MEECCRGPLGYARCTVRVLIVIATSCFFCAVRLHRPLASSTEEDKEPGLQMAKERDFKVSDS